MVMGTPRGRAARSAKGASLQYAFEKPSGEIGFFTEVRPKVRKVETVRGGDVLKACIRDRVGEVVTVNIGQARATMPKLVRKSTEGMTFLIANARREDDTGVLLMSPETFLQALEKRVSERTFEEVLSTLPFSGIELPRMKVSKWPGTGKSKVRIPE